MLNGPRCNGRAETAHHTFPTSQFPELFCAVEYIVGACKPCNYSDGAYVAAENRRQLVAQSEEIIVNQHNEIAELIARLARHENDPAPEPTRNRPVPRTF